MKKLDMSSYGVEELDTNEIKDIDGGFLTMTLVNTTLALGIVAVLGTMHIVTQILGGLGATAVVGAEIIM